MRLAKSEVYRERVQKNEKDFKKYVAKLNISENEKETLRKMFFGYGVSIDLLVEAINNEEK